MTFIIHDMWDEIVAGSPTTTKPVSIAYIATLTCLEISFVIDLDQGETPCSEEICT